VYGELVDISVGGAAVRFPSGTLPMSGLVTVCLPAAPPIKMEIVTSRGSLDGCDRAALRVPPMNWAALRVMALWMFHTPNGVVPGLPDGVPAVAILPTR
jgi:cellulose synthase (UDP-forming)